jgi:filamentous hemagglutinin family protein
MTHPYRLVWNKAHDCWVAVSECARSCGTLGASVSRVVRRHPQTQAHEWSGLSPPAEPPLPRPTPVALGMLVALAILIPSWGEAGEVAPSTLPKGASVAAGFAAIHQTAASMTVQQTSNAAVINWRSFDIGSAASVRFEQPSATSTVLNRVAAGTESQIMGKLSANGQVFLLNPSGVVFGASSQVDVRGLVASTMRMSDQDFMNGQYRLEGGQGVVVNQGQLTALEGGMIALLAPEVRNEGIIRAKLGKVMLAAGEAMTLTNTASGVGVVVERGAINALIENKGLVSAEDGTVFMSARAASALARAVIKSSGSVEASSATRVGGVIRLDAGNQGQVEVSGKLDASSTAGPGGQVVITGNAIALQPGASISATGATGGGEVLVGGDRQGQGDLQQAQTVSVASGARIDVSATGQGDGGTIRMNASEQIVLAQNSSISADAAANSTGHGGRIDIIADLSNATSSTQVDGSISAKGGDLGGDGGFIETSATNLKIADSARVSTLAPQGQAGN